MKILLVEPSYKSSILPFSLQKFAIYYMNKGHEVRFTHHPFQQASLVDDTRYDKILITSVFTYYGKLTLDTINFIQRQFPKARIKVGGIFPSLMPEVVEKHTGIKPWIGLYPKIDNELPDFSIFPKVKYGYVVTSRGCIHKCEFCAVKTLEPKFSLVDNWKAQVKHIYENGIRILNIQDNNFLATPKSHQRQVIEFLSQYKDLKIDFNQALEAKLFRPFHAELFKKINIPNLRFAFDGMHEDGYFQEAVKIARRSNKKQAITAYILYNFNDTPEDLWYRLTQAFSLRCIIHLMKYAPINQMSRRYIGEHWSKEKIDGLHEICSKISFVVNAIKYNAKDVKEKRFMKSDQFGSSPEEFVKLITTKKKLSGSFFAEVRRNAHVLNSGLGIIDNKDKEAVIKSRERAIETGYLNEKKWYNKVKGDYGGQNE